MMLVREMLMRLDKLELVQKQIVESVRGHEDDWRRQTVALRRDLATELDAVGVLLNRTGEMGLSEDVARECHSRFSALCNAITVHQLNWSAVRMDENSDGFRLSAKRTSDTSHAFVSLLRSQLSAVK